MKTKPTFDDLLRTKPDAEKFLYANLHEYAVAKGAKLETNSPYRRYRYSYKGEYVLVLDPYVAVQYNNQYSRKRDSRESFAEFISIAEKQPDSDALIKYIQNEICLCNACKSRKAGPKNNAERCGHLLDIRGVKRLAAACHPEISKCHFPEGPRVYTERDVNMLKRMMDIRFMQIDNYGR